MPAGSLDRFEGLARTAAVDVHDAPAGSGLNDHQRDVVGHDIVQLSGDAGALLRHGYTFSRFALPGQPGGLALQRVHLPLAAM